MNVIEKISYEYNPAIFIVRRCTIESDGRNNTVVNIDMEFMQVMIGGRMEIKILIPDSKEDNSYRREFFMTHVDLLK